MAPESTDSGRFDFLDMKNLSFQTFCLIFIVTIVHLILITVFAPISDSASMYFAELDVEKMLEQGRDDLAAMTDDDSIETRSDDADSELRSRHESETLENILESENPVPEREAVALLGRDGADSVLEPFRAASEPLRGAVAESRILAEQAYKKQIPKPNPFRAKVVESQDTTSSDNMASIREATPTAVAPHVPAARKTGAGNSMTIREIRPIPRS